MTGTMTWITIEVGLILPPTNGAIWWEGSFHSTHWWSYEQSNWRQNKKSQKWYQIGMLYFVLPRFFQYFCIDIIRQDYPIFLRQNNTLGKYFKREVLFSNSAPMSNELAYWHHIVISISSRSRFKFFVFLLLRPSQWPVVHRIFWIVQTFPSGVLCVRHGIYCTALYGIGRSVLHGIKEIEHSVHRWRCHCSGRRCTEWPQHFNRQHLFIIG